MTTCGVLTSALLPQRICCTEYLRCKYTDGPWASRQMLKWGVPPSQTHTLWLRPRETPHPNVEWASFPFKQSQISDLPCIWKLKGGWMGKKYIAPKRLKPVCHHWPIVVVKIVCPHASQFLQWLPQPKMLQSHSTANEQVNLHQLPHQRQEEMYSWCIYLVWVNWIMLISLSSISSSSIMYQQIWKSGMVIYWCHWWYQRYLYQWWVVCNLR